MNNVTQREWNGSQDVKAKGPKGKKTMATILGLLLLLGGAVAIIAIGTRVSLYFFTQDVLGVHPYSTHNTRAATLEQTTLEHSGTLHSAETFSKSSRYAWSGLALIAIISVIAILGLITVLGGVVH